MTAVETIGAEQARQLTDRIKVAVEGTWQLIAEAYQSRAWSLLGYGSWDDYCTREFGTSRLRLPAEDRVSTVRSLRQQGLSIRAIASGVGLSHTTIVNDLRGDQALSPVTPEPVGRVDAETGEFVELAGDLAAADAEYAALAAAVSPKVTGIDGKTYSPVATRAPNRKPLPDAAKSAGFELRSAMERVERLFDDSRYQQNAEQVALMLRGHLLYVAETVAAVLDQLS